MRKTSLIFALITVALSIAGCASAPEYADTPEYTVTSVDEQPIWADWDVWPLYAWPLPYLPLNSFPDEIVFTTEQAVYPIDFETIVSVLNVPNHYTTQAFPTLYLVKLVDDEWRVVPTLRVLQYAGMRFDVYTEPGLPTTFILVNDYYTEAERRFAGKDRTFLVYTNMTLPAGTYRKVTTSVILWWGRTRDGYTEYWLEDWWYGNVWAEFEVVE